MGYQVLARKYRPSNFQEMEGQEHVLRALINSLAQNRLHHAYLFAGTRGVGKTTIARILAKCFNCETGVTATPCGECSTCLEIAQGRSVDLIEVDAASRTRVEDTRELLDNVQYMPTRNRFKVYLIDEVHMLSNHSFNALLKTLEEPPEHVKFLLATTDPKKLPVTVLSRCLQFNLKNLSPERVVNYLKVILEKENISYEEPALWQLGRAADGSMRDALSLTDQAISFGENTLSEVDVRAMLGTIDQREVYELIDALMERDAKKLLTKIADLAAFGPDFEMLLAELLGVLHRVAVAQAVPDGVDNSQGDRDRILAVAGRLGVEEVQLYYQIGLIGQRDLPLAPDPRDGFEMVMLRMLAFAPEQLVAGDGGRSASAGQTASAGKEVTQTATTVPENNAGSNAVADLLSRIKGGKTSSPPDETSDAIPWDDSEGIAGSGQLVQGRPEDDTDEALKQEPGVQAQAPDLKPEDWHDVFEALNISGVTRTLAANCVITEVNDDVCVLVLNEHHASLWNKTHETRIGKALTEYLGREIVLRIDVGTTPGETPAQAKERIDEENRVQAVNAISNDENVQRLIETFDGRLKLDSIVPRSHVGE